MWGALDEARHFRPDVSKRRIIPYDIQDPEMPGGGSREWLRSSKKIEALIYRFWFGLIGGLALIVPVIIMTLQNNLVVALITSSVATMLFAVFLSFFADKDPLELVGYTAAYAAVMVVFIGSAFPSS